MENKIKLEGRFDNSIGLVILQLIILIPVTIAFGLIIKSLTFIILTSLLFIAVTIANYAYSNYLVFNKIIIEKTDIEFKNKIKNRHESLNNLNEIRVLLQRGANVVFIFKDSEIKSFVYIDKKIIDKIVSNIYGATVLTESENIIVKNYKINRKNLTTVST